MKQFILNFLTFLAIYSAAQCFADEPLERPAAQTTCSPSRKFCVDFVPGEDGIAFQVNKNNNKREVWRVRGWHRLPFVSDDGRHLATCYEGENLIPQDYSPKLVMVSIYDKGRLKHEIHLNELISNFGALQKTVSHFNWGSCIELTEEGMLKIQTVENRELTVDLTSGEVHRK